MSILIGDVRAFRISLMTERWTEKHQTLPLASSCSLSVENYKLVKLFCILAELKSWYQRRHLVRSSNMEAEFVLSNKILEQNQEQSVRVIYSKTEFYSAKTNKNLSREEIGR